MSIKPGVPPTNEPTDFAYLTDERLLTNSNITRMPTNQQAWGSFIRELDKWIKNETGSFDVGGSATAQFVGFSADPTNANCWWHRYGMLVHMSFDFTTGTSNATDFRITGIPEIIRTRDDHTVAMGGFIDSGSELTGAQAVTFRSNGEILFRTSGSTGAWTSSGTKGMNITTASVIYSLRQPGKH